MYKTGEQRLGGGNTCQTPGSPCSKNNKFLFFGEKQRSLSIEAATLMYSTHRGAGRVIAPPGREQLISLPLLLSTSCILGLLWMQAGLGITEGFQQSWQTMNFHRKTMLTFSNFLSGQRAEKASFGGSASPGGIFHLVVSADTGQQPASCGWVLCTELFGSISSPCPSGSLQVQQFASPNLPNCMIQDSSSEPPLAWGCYPLLT